MSLYIKGVGLPPSGEAYVIYPDGSLNRQVCGICQCGLDGTAIELPPHGDLIDKKMVLSRGWDMETFYDAVRYAPAIIPADQKDGDSQ